MKKVLLATSILAASAGFAAAEVAVSGSARMGVTYNYWDANANGLIDIAEIAAGPEAKFSSRVRIVFTASGETDGGLSFGASVRNDQSGVGNDRNGDSTVYISGAFGKLTMGDVGGAADALVGQVSGVGYTGLNDFNEIGFIGTHKTAVYYEYSTGALTFGVGSGQLITGDATHNVGVKYSTDAYSVALGWETDTLTGEDRISALGSATFGAATVKLKVADSNIALTNTAMAMSVDYTTGAATITAFATNNVNFGTMDTYGLGVSYDLGGGAALVGGIVDNSVDTIADLGVTMSF